MITLQLSRDTRPSEVTSYLGTVTHSVNGVAAGINWDYQSTLATRRYMCGLEPPNYPMPAIPTAFFESDTATISIWPGVIQYRISDEYLDGEYTGFGAVITIEWWRDAGCYELRYDDFN